MKHILMGMAIVVGLAGCNASKNRTSDKFVVPVQTPQVQALVDDGALLLDVRDAELFAEGRLPGAVNLHLPRLTAGGLEAVAGKRPVVVYGYGGRGLSAAAIKKLLAQDYDPDRLFDYRGGLLAWTQAGGEVETVDSLPASATQPN